LSPGCRPLVNAYEVKADVVSVSTAEIS